MVGWWLETGIYSKMESDVWLKKMKYKNWTTEWKRPTTNPKESLELGHVLPIFIIFGALIIFSVVVFWLELLNQRHRRMRHKVDVITTHMFSAAVFGLELLNQRYRRMRQKADVITTHIERRMEDTQATVRAFIEQTLQAVCQKLLKA